MSVPRICCIIALLLSTASAPLWGQSLVASPATATISYKSGDPLPSSVTVTISPTVSITAHITTNINSSGSQVSAADAAGVFSISVGSSQVTVGILDATTLSLIANRGAPATYSGTLTVSATGYPNLTVPLVLNIVTASSTLTATPSSLTLSVGGTGLTTSTALTLQSSSGTTFTTSIVETTSPNIGWLSVSPASGSLTANTPLVLTVFASALGLGVSDYIATITITSPVGTATIPVRFSVGVTSLIVNPTSLVFTYSIGGPLPSAQNVTVSGTTSTTYLATPTTTTGGLWLLVNNVAGPQSLSVTQALPVSVSPLALTAGTYRGNVTINTLDGTSNVSVTLIVLAAGSSVFTPSALVFNYVGGVLPSAQQVTIGGTGNYTLQAQADLGLTWLSVSPAAGSLPATVTVSVSPAGLTTATYTGVIQLTVDGSLSGALPITLVVGSAGSTTFAAPSSLTFTVPAGQNSGATQPLIVNGDGSNYTAVASSDALWLSVSPPNGSTPTILNVVANPFSLGAGTYSGTVTVTTNLGTQAVAVRFNVVNGTLLRPNPEAFAFTYTAGKTAPSTQNVTVSSNLLGSPLSFTVSTGTPWIVLTQPASLNTPSSFSFNIDTTKLAGGLNNGTISLTASGAANSPVNIPVTVLATGISSVVVNPASLTFSAAVRGSSVTQTLSVNPGTGVPFTATAASDGNWLSVSPTSGIGGSTLTVTANPGGLTNGTYSGSITVTTGGTSYKVTVTLNISTGTLSVSSGSLVFNFAQGAPTPASQSLNITSSGVAATTTITSDQPWLTVSPTSGVTPFTVSVSVNPAGLAAGANNGTLTITAPGLTGSPQLVGVTLNVSSVQSLLVSASSASFLHQVGGSPPNPQQVTVSSSGASLSFSVSTSAPWITATPTSGTTPATLTISVNPAGLNPGTNTGRVSITAGALSQNIEVTLSITAPLPSITSVVNLGSRTAGPVAPGEIVLVTGQNMAGPDLIEARASGGVFGTTLGGARLRFSGVEAPLLSVRSDQIMAVVPYGVAGRAATFAQVEYGDQRSNAFNLDLAASAPGIITADSSGSGLAAALNEDGTVNGPDNPASPNTIVQFFFTGEGETIPKGVDGKVADDPNNLPKPVLMVSAQIDNQPADIVYFGASPGRIAGAAQADLRVPPTVAPDPRPGQVSVVITVGNASTQQGVTIWVR